MKKGSLYIVATPIGNLADISFRAVDILKSVAVIAAEDTRHSQRLLSHYDIDSKKISLHEHNEAQRCAQIIRMLEKGEDVALVSDAGTPLISDPGYRLVAAVQQQGLPVVPVPGACAVIAALSVAGLPTDQFKFIGFLASKGAVRKKALQVLVKETCTLVFYESTHRIIDFIKLAVAVFGAERLATIARELTKTFETVKRASLGELLHWLQADANQRKGEFVVMLQGADATALTADEQEQQRVLQILLEELSVKQASVLAAKLTGGAKKQLYQSAILLKK